MDNFLNLKESGLVFHKVQNQNLYISSEFLEGNALFLNRVLGNPDPKNMALGALVMDYDQACHLINLLNLIDEHMKLKDNEDIVKTYHLRQAIEDLAYFLQEVVIEPNQ